VAMDVEVFVSSRAPGTLQPRDEAQPAVIVTVVSADDPARQTDASPAGVVSPVAAPGGEPAPGVAKEDRPSQLPQDVASDAAEAGEHRSEAGACSSEPTETPAG